MKTPEYLDAAKRLTGLPSDYALASRLGVSRQAVSSWRSEKRRVFPDVLHAVTLAEMCSMDPIKVLADIEMDKAEYYAKTSEIDAWKLLLQRMGGVAASLVLGTVLSSPSPAAAAMKTAQADTPAMYIMSTRRRRNAAWLAPLFGLMRLA